MADKTFNINFGSISANSTTPTITGNIPVQNTEASNPIVGILAKSSTVSVTAKHPSPAIGASALPATYSNIPDPKLKLFLNINGIDISAPIQGAYKRADSVISVQDLISLLVTFGGSYSSSFLSNSSLSKSIGINKNTSLGVLSLVTQFNTIKTIPEPVGVDSLIQKSISSTNTSSVLTPSLPLKLVSILKTNTLTSISNRTISVSKLLSDILVATDDVLGEANIDDDQTAWVDKVLFTINTITDRPLKSINKPFSNTYSVISTPLKLYGANKSSTYSASTFLTALIVIARTLSSSSNILSGISSSSINLGKSSTTISSTLIPTFNINRVNISDYLALSTPLNSVSKLLPNSIATTLSVLAYIITMGKNLDSFATAAATRTYLVNKISTSLVSALSSIPKSVNIVKPSSATGTSISTRSSNILKSSASPTNSTRVISTEKVSISTNTVSGVYAGKTPSIFKVATATSADFGTGVSQGYFADPTYSETQDYVGTLYTLT
jgi:hypothetical protein